MNKNTQRISQNSIDLDDLISDLHEQSEGLNDLESFANHSEHKMPA